jgi:hypothetical protein
MIYGLGGVMSLFLLIGLLAAFGNRNLLFEQRMAGATFRSMLVKQMGDAALDWSIAQLNSDKLDSACAPSNTVSAKRFSDLYFDIDTNSRKIVAKERTLSDALGPTNCVRLSDGRWDCRCPAASDATARAAVSSADEIQPSFGVFLQTTQRPGTLVSSSYSCSSPNGNDCESTIKATVNRFNSGWQGSVLGFVPALRSPPTAALTAKGAIVATDGDLRLHNSDGLTNGILVVSGSASYPSSLTDSKLESIPGTPPRDAIVTGDSVLAAGDPFRLFIGMPSDRFKYHPKVRKPDCTPDCVSSIKTAVSFGASIIYVDGNLSIDSDVDLGTINDPVLIAASGTINISARLQMYGVLLSGGNIIWNAGAGGFLVGALISGADVTTTGPIDIAYSSGVNLIMKNKIGGFVLAPGGWHDHKY